MVISQILEKAEQAGILKDAKNAQHLPSHLQSVDLIKEWFSRVLNDDVQDVPPPPLRNIAAYAYQDVHVWSACGPACGPLRKHRLV